MARKNIFEVLLERQNNNLDADIDRFINLLDKKLIVSSGASWYLEDFVDKYCLPHWKQRGRYLSCDDIKETLAIDTFGSDVPYDFNDFFVFIEYLCNLIWLCDQYIEKKSVIKLKKTIDFAILEENIYKLLDEYNFEIKIFSEDEKVIIVEKNPAATAVAEIVESNTAYEVIQYNHYLLKGDIEKKKKALKALADKFESIRPELKKIDKQLESNAGYLLNKLNIRHNNIEGKNAIDYVKNLSEKELEEWYDETYQMLLLCILEHDNIERNKKVENLKRIIEQ